MSTEKSTARGVERSVPWALFAAEPAKVMRLSSRHGRVIVLGANGEVCLTISKTRAPGR